MKITIVQPDSAWEDKQANFAAIGRLLTTLSGNTDLVVLPEMFNTGFSLNAENLAEDVNGLTFNWMADLVKGSGFAVCGSFIIKSDNKYFNQLFFVSPQQQHYTYRKRHLFSLGGENEKFSPGGRREVFNYGNLRFLPVICYDLRFPVWTRNRGDYDVLLCVASWPDVRREAWNALLKARAIENQCYVIGVNRVGIDNEGLKYAGDSVILDPLGRILCSVKEYQEGTATIDVSLEELQNFRKKLPFWKDADDFTIT